MNQEAKAYHSFPARNGCSSGVRAKSCTRQQKRCLQLTQAIENKEPSTYPAVIVTDFVKLPKLGRLQLTIREWLVTKSLFFNWKLLIVNCQLLMILSIFTLLPYRSHSGKLV